MKTVELRNKINQYTSVADDTVLKIVNAVFETYEKENVNECGIQIPEIFTELIKKGLEDSKTGKVKSHNTVMENVKKRYYIAS
jgi:predicted transcriptional regulator